MKTLTLENALLGTKAPSVMGGYWIRVERGWRWCTDDIFPRPGGDWTGELIPPDPSEMTVSESMIRIREAEMQQPEFHPDFERMLARAESDELKEQIGYLVAERDALRVENECLRAVNELLCDAVTMQEQESATLRERVKELEADAARYQFLRSHADTEWHDNDYIIRLRDIPILVATDDIDPVIDTVSAAMQEDD